MASPCCLPLRPLDIHTTTRDKRPAHLEWRKGSVSSEMAMRSPTSSCSRDSFAESEATFSTAPSSPRSPIRKHTHIDLQLHSTVPTRPHLHAEAFSADATLPPLRRASAKDVLPGLDTIQKPLGFPKPAQSNSFGGVEQSIHSPSPEPCQSSDYIPSGHTSVDHDPITSFLNEERRRRSIVRRQSHRQVDFRSLNTPEFAPRWPRRLDYGQSPVYIRRASFDPSYFHAPHDALQHVHHGGISKKSLKAKNASHCNKRYTKEQKDYIRYFIVDEKMKWDDLQVQFAQKFPDMDFDRFTQGLQGVYYRQNKELPMVDNKTNQLIYMSNGHVKAWQKKCRDQSDKKTYGMVNLFPECAVTYPWVKEEHKRRAAELAEPRQQEREEAKQCAKDAGIWEEILIDSNCACCAHLRPDKV